MGRTGKGSPGPTYRFLAWRDGQKKVPFTEIQNRGVKTDWLVGWGEGR